jgi:CxxC motif-containing protein (DUF1111 family)
MKNTILAIGCAALILSCTENDENASRKLDGETTVFVQTSQAFGLPAPNLSAENLEKHLLEAIPENRILANADPDDLDKDGIQGIIPFD